MATIRRWDPIRDLMSIEDDLSRMLGRTFAGAEPVLASGGWIPPLDLYEKEDGFVVTLEVPGIDPEAVEVSVEDSTLTISGAREFYGEATEEQFHRMERRFGAFSRVITLPTKADPERIQATYDRGILTVEVPKSEQAKPRRITVKAVG